LAASLRVDLQEMGGSLAIWQMLAIVAIIVFVLFFLGMLGKTCI
jgi:hypothetical protein